MERIYFRNWVSCEGKRFDSQNKHIFCTLTYLLLYHTPPGVLHSILGVMYHQVCLSLGGLLQFMQLNLNLCPKEEKKQVFITDLFFLLFYRKCVPLITKETLLMHCIS